VRGQEPIGLGLADHERPTPFMFVPSSCVGKRAAKPKLKKVVKFERMIVYRLSEAIRCPPFRVFTMKAYR
jgi:hypothetical protein